MRTAGAGCKGGMERELHRDRACEASEVYVVVEVVVVRSVAQEDAGEHGNCRMRAAVAQRAETNRAAPGRRRLDSVAGHARLTTGRGTASIQRRA
jgi:hypothetical protein